MKKQQFTNGGKRAGAGRPPLYGTKSEQIAVSVPPDLAARLTRYARGRKISRSALIVELLRDALAEKNTPPA